MPGRQPSALIEQARRILEVCWKETQTTTGPSEAPSLPGPIRDAVGISINSATKSYRYVLPTQLLAKLADPSLDCRAVQESAKMPGSFDARTLCKDVIVPFDRAHHNVLGGSGDPYVSNPLRIPAITKEARSAQRDREGFDALCAVVDYVEKGKGDCKAVFQVALGTILGRLQKVKVLYPVPNRVSLSQATSLVESFLSQRTGGVRMQAVSAGLFRAIGEMFAIFERVVSKHVNVADLRTGSAADLECLASDGSVMIAVEVKDRQLTLTDVQDKLQTARQKGVRELLYLVRGIAKAKDAKDIEDLAQREFAAGQNVYVCKFSEFLHAAMILLQEKGRRIMLQRTGAELDERGDLSDRQTWGDLLASL